MCQLAIFCFLNYQIHTKSSKHTHQTKYATKVAITHPYRGKPTYNERYPRISKTSSHIWKETYTPGRRHTHRVRHTYTGKYRTHIGQIRTQEESTCTQEVEGARKRRGRRGKVRRQLQAMRGSADQLWPFTAEYTSAPLAPPPPLTLCSLPTLFSPLHLPPSPTL